MTKCRSATVAAKRKFCSTSSTVKPRCFISRTVRPICCTSTGAKLLLLDEPTEGLAPVIVQQIGRTIREIKNRGFTVLLVEQNFRFAQTVADRHYVVEHGRVIDMIPNHRLEASMDKLHEYLGV